eukprot:5860706-Alexandrium_andersonii.AAC.1
MSAHVCACVRACCLRSRVPESTRVGQRGAAACVGQQAGSLCHACPPDSRRTIGWRQRSWH